MHARQTKSPTYSKAFIEWVLASQIVSPAAPLIGVFKVGLWRDGDFLPTNLTTKAEFAAKEATFTDYVKPTVVLTGPRSVGAVGRANGGVANWLITTDPLVTGNRIYGYWTEDAVRVVSFEKFTAPDQIDMSEVGAALMLEVLLPLPYLVPLA